MPEYLTTTEAASRLSMPISTLTWHCRHGRLGTKPANGKGWIITASDVAKFAKALARKSTAKK